MERDELISKMQGRVDMCRRLARTTTDQRAAEVLAQMAREVDEDMKRLQSERDNPTSDQD